MSIFHRIIKACGALFTYLKYNAHMLKCILKFVEQSVSLNVFASHLEQEAQARMTRIRIDTMLTNHLIIGRKQHSERESLNVRLPFGAGDDLVKETDI
jgi:hypothetical protein